MTAISPELPHFGRTATENGSGLRCCTSSMFSLCNLPMHARHTQKSKSRPLFRSHFMHRLCIDCKRCCAVLGDARVSEEFTAERTTVTVFKISSLHQHRFACIDRLIIHSCGWVYKTPRSQELGWMDGRWSQVSRVDWNQRAHRLASCCKSTFLLKYLQSRSCADVLSSTAFANLPPFIHSLRGSS